MPIASPDAWADARTNWELMPEMTLTEVAARLDVAVPTASIRAKREGWAKVAVIDATLPEQTSAQLVISAMRRLSRICETSKDDNTAIKAARIILEHTLGRPQTATGLPAPPEGSQEWPEWLSSQRLGYRAGDYADDGFEPPADQPQLSQDAPEAPAQSLPEPPSSAPAPFRPLHLVQHAAPTFYDRPDLPAEGPTRDPSRH